MLETLDYTIRIGSTPTFFIFRFVSCKRETPSNRILKLYNFEYVSSSTHYITIYISLYISLYIYQALLHSIEHCCISAITIHYLSFIYIYIYTCIFLCHKIIQAYLIVIVFLVYLILCECQNRMKG